MLGEGSTSDVNRSYGASEKKFSIKFTKRKTKILLEFALPW